jgi:hypothetical protein
MVIFALGVLGNAADGVDAFEKCGELHRPAKGSIGTLPAC